MLVTTNIERKCALLASSRCRPTEGGQGMWQCGFRVLGNDEATQRVRPHTITYEGRMGIEMAKNLKLLLSLVMACQVGMVLPASSQSNPPIGTANTVGSVSNFNANNLSSSNAAQSSSSSPSSSPGILLPRGGTATTSNSTIVVCDDPGAPFPNVVDVCSLK
jgi:hypothetical protein